jgi:tetratricopeptide (TPR) repeat protein
MRCSPVTQLGSKLTAALLLAAIGVTLPGVCHAESDPDFDLRLYAEVYYKDGRKEVGLVTPTDDPKLFKIKAVRTQISHDFNTDDVKDWRDKRTAETAMEEFAKDWADKKNAGLLLKRMRYAWEHWNVQKKIVALLESASTSNEPDVLEYLSDLYMQTGRNADALRIAGSLVAAAPQRARSYMWRGKAALALGNMTGADADLKKAFEMAPGDEAIQIARSNFLIAAGKPGEAKKLLGDLLVKNPKNSSATVAQGMVLLKQGDFEAAEQIFNDAPLDNEQGQIGLASTKLMRKQYDDAYRIAEGVLRRNPKSAEAYGMEALSKLFSGDKESLDKFDEKIAESFKEKPDQPRLLLAQAVGLEREAKYIELAGGKTAPDDARIKHEASLAKYKELFAKDTADAYLKYFIGEWNFRKGDYTAAEEAFNKVAELAPTYTAGLSAAGATALRLRKWDAAEKYYEAAGGLDPASGEFQAGQGLALLGQKELGKAKEKLSRAITLDARNVSALCGLGYISNLAREKSSAVGFFEQALSIDGKCAYAADALKKIYSQEGKDLEYETFDDNVNPVGWSTRGRGLIKPVIQDGHVVFAGTQGSSQGEAIEFYKEVKTDAFVRLEADWMVPVGSAVTCGVRLSGVGGSRFFLEFAKTEADEMKVRFLDSVGTTDDWKGIGIKWPDDGRARLAIETDELKAGKCLLSINGKKVTEVTLKLNRTNAIAVAVFVQAPPSSSFTAIADNLSLLTRRSQTGGGDGAGGDAIKILKDDKPAPAPEPAAGGGDAAPKDKDGK